MQAVVVVCETAEFTMEAVEATATVVKTVTPFVRVIYRAPATTTFISVGGNSLSAVPNDLIKDGDLAGV